MSRFLANEIEKIEQMVYPKVTLTSIANGTYTATMGNETVSGTLNSQGIGDIYLPEIGTWNITVTSSSGARTGQVTVSSAGGTSSLSIEYATLTVTSDIGNTITATNGNYSVSGIVGAGGTIDLTVGTGTWTISSGNGTVSVSDSVIIGTADSSALKSMTLPTITVIAAVGASISAVKDGVAVSGTADSNGECVLKVSVGTWEVSATSDGETNTENVVVSAHSTNSDVDLRFAIHIYGAQWTSGESTAWTRTDDAVSFGACNPYVSGALSYDSPFDDLMPWSGMTVSERTGGTMVAIPKFWYKITSVGSGGLKVQIADNQVEDFSVCPACMDRGDGAGERDVVYIGRYHCNAYNYKSETGKSCYKNITRSTARSTIHNLGTNIWQSDWAIRFTIWLLYIVEFADWDSQTKIGYGCSTDGASVGMRMGYTDSMPYHTGTTESSRTTYGGTQYRNIEGLWDNVKDWCDGCYSNYNGMNIILNPSNFDDKTNGTLVGQPASGYPSKFSVINISGTFPMFIPSESSESSTYTTDMWNFNTSSGCPCVGGSRVQSLTNGLFFTYYYNYRFKDLDIGARLQELP